MKKFSKKNTDFEVFLYHTLFACVIWYVAELLFTTTSKDCAPCILFGVYIVMTTISAALSNIIYGLYYWYLSTKYESYISWTASTEKLTGRDYRNHEGIGVMFALLWPLMFIEPLLFGYKLFIQFINNKK